MLEIYLLFLKSKYIEIGEEGNTETSISEMCSLEESDEAYQYLGFPGYNPHIPRETFQKYYDRAEQKAATASVSDHKKLLLINSQRVFNIAASGSTWQEREDLARTYFEMVHAVELGTSPDLYLDPSSSDSLGNRKSPILMQIYQVNGNQNIYGFRPILRYGYLYNRLLKAGYLIGKASTLKKLVDWTYAPPGLELSKIEYLCGPSYFRKVCRKRLQRNKERLPSKFLKEPNWYHWPDLLNY